MCTHYPSYKAPHWIKTQRKSGVLFSLKLEPSGVNVLVKAFCLKIWPQTTNAPDSVLKPTKATGMAPASKVQRMMPAHLHTKPFPDLHGNKRAHLPWHLMQNQKRGERVNEEEDLGEGCSKCTPIGTSSCLAFSIKTFPQKPFKTRT